MRAYVQLRLPMALAMAALAGCASAPARHTLGDLRTVKPDVAEVDVQDSLDLAMSSYRRFLEETETGAMTPEAMRRLADLQLEKEYGIAGGSPQALPAPRQGFAPAAVRDTSLDAPAGAVAAAHESDEEFERRATQQQDLGSASARGVDLPGGESLPHSGPLEAIAIYKRLLAEYPNYERSDQVIYQMARAYDELGQTEQAMEAMQRLVDEYGYSKYSDEVNFRRAEYFFTRSKYRDAERAYQAITSMGARSEYYELALYKLGWTLYKQDFYEDALHQYMALLDYKLSIGYDFDQRHEEEDERRVADTFRVISLSFSNLGGVEVLPEFFASYGAREYEDRIYRNLGEFYLEKLRYQDAATAYASFVKLHPLHRASPRFSMRVIEIYQQGDFPKLVVESKKDFARDYGLRAEYWRHFDVNESPEVLSFLKTNLRDLANHYHSLYQDESARRRRSRRTIARRSRGIESFSPRSRRIPSRRRSTIRSRTCCSRTRTSRRLPRVRAHGLRLSAARALVRGGLCGDLRAPRVSERRCRCAEDRGSACDGHELAQVRGHVRRARARAGGSRRGRAGPLRDEGFSAREGVGPQARRPIPVLRSGAPPPGVDDRRAFVVRARGLSGGGGGVRARARAHSRGRCGPRGARRQPRGVDLQARRASERGGRLSRGGRRLPTNQGRGADVDRSSRRRSTTQPSRWSSSRIGRRPRTCSTSSGARFRITRSRPKRRSSSRSRIGRAARPRSRRANTSASRRMRKIPSLGARRCSRPRISTSRQPIARAHSRSTKSTSRHSRSPSKPRSRRGGRWRDTYEAKGDPVCVREAAARDRRARRVGRGGRTNRTKYLAAQSGLVLAGQVYSQFAELEAHAAVRSEPHGEARAHGRRDAGVRRPRSTTRWRR